MVPVLELQVNLGHGRLTGGEGDIGLEGVDRGHHLGSDEYELGGVVEGRGAVCEVGWEKGEGGCERRSEKEWKEGGGHMGTSNSISWSMGGTAWSTTSNVMLPVRPMYLREGGKVSSATSAVAKKALAVRTHMLRMTSVWKAA
jgi:hypothetical protein